MRDLLTQANGTVRLGAPLSEEQVVAFETEHGAALPYDYRTFLTKVGHGGDGPGLGLLTLDRWELALEDVVPGALSWPCPLDPALGFRDYAYDPARGTLTLCVVMASTYTLLVVSGPNRGRLAWYDADSRSARWVTPERGFLAWYADWLEHGRCPASAGR